MQLDGHIVLVTGASGTLGQAMCAAIEAAGGIAVRSDLASRGMVDIALDVTKEADWQAAAAAIEKTHGRLDGLVNNAGVGTPGTIEETTFETWRHVMAVNADGVFLGCKYAMPLLAKGAAPSIVNISSASGMVGGANLAAYNASKGAVRLMTKSAALECAPLKVRVNSIHPGIIDTPMMSEVATTLAGESGVNDLREQFASRHALGRMGRDIDVANGIKFLCSDAAAFMTGSELVVDGGMTAI